MRAVAATGLLCSLVLAGCAVNPTCPAPPGPPPAKVFRYESASWADLPGWSSDAVQEAWPAFLASCHDLRFRPVWSEVCSAAAAIAPDAEPAELRAYFRQYFAPWRLQKGVGAQAETSGLVTGYYEPLLRGARAPSTEFNTALYAPPADLLTVDLSSLYPELKGKAVRGRLDGTRVVPFYTRAELAADPALRGKELLWVDSALDAFTLEIQGSGRVQLVGGETVRVQYADQNGQPYHSIGRYLVDKGLLTVEQATMPGIRAWLEANPARMQEVLDANPSVVFFKEAPLGNADEGPKGAESLPLTAGRSIAVDAAYVPLGTPVFLATTYPATDAPLQRLVVAQDTGGAIRGAPRADFFWGTGDEARDMAGKMRQTGEMWLLWPQGLPLPQPPRSP